MCFGQHSLIAIGADAGNTPGLGWGVDNRRRPEQAAHSATRRQQPDHQADCGARRAHREPLQADERVPQVSAGRIQAQARRCGTRGLRVGCVATRAPFARNGRLRSEDPEEWSLMGWLRLRATDTSLGGFPRPSTADRVLDQQMQLERKKANEEKRRAERTMPKYVDKIDSCTNLIAYMQEASLACVSAASSAVAGQRLMPHPMSHALRYCPPPPPSSPGRSLARVPSFGDDVAFRPTSTPPERGPRTRASCPRRRPRSSMASSSCPRTAMRRT